MTSNQQPGQAPQDQVGELWRIVGACLVVGGTIAGAIVLSAMLVGLVLPDEVLRPNAGGEPSRVATWASLIGFQAFSIILIVAFVGVRTPGQIKFTFALTPPQVGLPAIIQTFVVFAIVQALFSWMSYTFFYDAVVRDLDLFRRIIVDTPLWVAFLALVVGAPVSEEVLFRGFLMNRLSQTRLGFGGATIAATLGWTLLHFGYSTIGLMEVFLAGLMFSWALWRTGSLWVPMAFHALYNAIVLAIIVSLPAPTPV